MCSQVWLSEKPEQRSMKFYQNSNHMLIESDSYPPLLEENAYPAKDKEDFLQSELEEKMNVDEDNLVFMDCEPVSADTERFLSENDQFTKLKEPGQEARTDTNTMKRKRSWKKRKCLSLDTKRWDNAKETISKGTKYYLL